MNIIRRLFVPELQQAVIERDWFQARCDEMIVEMVKVKTDLDAEVVRNRCREDDLFNKLLMANGTGTLKTRIEEPQIEEVILGLDEAEAMQLRGRAMEYATQHSPLEDVSEDEVESAYQMMLEDPQYWLSD